MKTILLVTLTCLVGATASANIYKPKTQPKVESPSPGAAFAGFSCELTEAGRKIQITGIKEDSKNLPIDLEGVITRGEILVQRDSEKLVFKIDALMITAQGFGGRNFGVEASSQTGQKLSIRALIGSSVGKNGHFKTLQDATVVSSGQAACRLIKNSDLANQK